MARLGPQSGQRLLDNALMLEQNDEWAVGRRYMRIEGLAPVSDVPHAWRLD